MAYAEVEELKAQLGITASDDARDDQLERVLTSVSGQLDAATGRSFSVAESATARVINPRNLVQQTDDGPVLVVPDIGSRTGLTVKAGSGGTYGTTVSAALVETWPTEAIDDGTPATGLLLLSGSWPSSSGTRVQITARWGWPAVPAVVKEATLIQASRIWKRKDSPEGVLGSAEWGAVRLSRVDPDVEAMLAPLRLDVALVG